MTTTSAGNGPSGGDGGRDDGDWGWFTPPKAQSDRPAADEDASRREDGQEETGGPGRSRNAIRPVGSGAARARQAQPPQAPSAPTRQPYQQPQAQQPYQPQPQPQQPPQQPPPPAYGQSPAPGHPGTPDPAAGFETAREHPAPSPQSAPLPHHHQPEGPPRDDAFAPDPVPADGVESRDAMLIRHTMEEVEPSADAATAYFYALLFVQHPQLRELFPASMDTQRDRLFRALLTAVRLADDPDVLSRYLSGLGRGHRKYGTLPEHYPAVGECLLGALAQYTPNTWSAETEEAWVRAYTTISQTMIDAAAEDELRAPAWWNAQIVSHEMRTPHVAVITLRTDQPYPFLAGQYTSVETPWWPRVWRHYSFASAPRSDGLITFHVKAVPTGWVSSALVHRARPGDVLRLGPPAGSMTVDHANGSGLLCVGGGTGIAPVKALVEDVVQHGRSRPVDVFYGAPSEHDLYDLETMLRLEQQHSWLTVRPVVAGGPAPSTANALSGQLPDAVRQYGPWSSYVGYLSGPPGLIRSGVEALVESGVPANRIRHDAVADLIVSGD